MAGNVIARKIQEDLKTAEDNLAAAYEVLR